MAHGWTVRGDISDPEVKRDVSEAIKLCRKYFQKFKSWFLKTFNLEEFACALIKKCLKIIEFAKLVFNPK